MSVPLHAPAPGWAAPQRRTTLIEIFSPLAAVMSRGAGGNVAGPQSLARALHHRGPLVEQRVRRVGVAALGPHVRDRLGGVGQPEYPATLPPPPPPPAGPVHPARRPPPHHA